jgi:hypothetical protein
MMKASGSVKHGRRIRQLQISGRDAFLDDPAQLMMHVRDVRGHSTECRASWMRRAGVNDVD